MSALASRGSLTFDWRLRDKISRHLVKFLFFSLLLHAFGFYIFQVVYPPNVSIAPPPAVISLLTPASPENRALLDWIASEDPSIVATPHAATPPGLTARPYKPSFAEARSLPRLPVEKWEPVPFPPASDITGLVESAMPRAAKKPDTIPAPPTSVRFSGGLSDRILAENQPLHLANKSAANLESASFLLAVSPEGGVAFVFLQKSSGDKAVDHEAERHLARLKFAPAGNHLTWGAATILWGGDAFSGSPQPALRTPQSP